MNIRQTLFVTTLASFNSVNAEMLQVSADGTVRLSTDSIEVKTDKGGKQYVVGMIYVKENGGTGASPFAVRCNKGGTLIFRKGDGTLGEEHRWSANGQTVVDAIAITACKLSKIR